MPQLKVRSISVSSMAPACCSQLKMSGRGQASGRIRAANRSLASMRGTFSRKPPPVMWAMPRTSASASRASTGRA